MQEVAALGAAPVGRRPQGASAEPAGLVAQQRVLAGPRRELALGHAEDEQQVEVGPDHVGHGCDENAASEPGGLPDGGLELGFEHLPEAAEAGVVRRAVEAADAAQRMHDGVVCRQLRPGALLEAGGPGRDLLRAAQMPGQAPSAELARVRP